MRWWAGELLMLEGLQIAGSKTMKAHWLILTMDRAHGVWVVCEAVERAGYPYKCAAELPVQPNAIYPDDHCVIVNEPAERIAQLQATRPWIPIGWCDPSTFACRTYYAHWGKYVLQRHYAMVPFGDLARQKAWLFDNLADGRRLFVRPDAHDKVFDADVIGATEFDSWQRRLTAAGVSPETLCVVAQPQVVQDEWRLVIRDRRVITGSSYRIGGKVVTSQAPPGEVVAFAESVAADPYPSLPTLYVIDVCSRGDRLAVVEVGSINSSGFYGCDLGIVVTAMSDEAEATWTRARETTATAPT